MPVINTDANCWHVFHSSGLCCRFHLISLTRLPFCFPSTVRAMQSVRSRAIISSYLAWESTFCQSRLFERLTLFQLFGRKEEGLKWKEKGKEALKLCMLASVWSPGCGKSWLADRLDLHCNRTNLTKLISNPTDPPIPQQLSKTHFHGNNHARLLIKAKPSLTSNDATPRPWADLSRSPLYDRSPESLTLGSTIQNLPPVHDDSFWG